MKETFCILDLTRDDLEMIGYDGSKVTDEQMEEIAKQLQYAILDFGFFPHLKDYAEYFELPKLEDNG